MFGQQCLGVMDCARLDNRNMDTRSKSTGTFQYSQRPTVDIKLCVYVCVCVFLDCDDFIYTSNHKSYIAVKENKEVFGICIPICSSY